MSRLAIALVGLGLAACAATGADPTAHCATLAATCGGDGWADWCRQACVPDAARARPCDATDVCALCNDDGTLYTWSTGCVPTARVCDDASPCPPGQRTYAIGGACLPTEPCAGETTCRAQGRACEAAEGVARCGRCLDDRDETSGACVAATPAYVGAFRVSRDHFAVWDGTRYRSLFVRGVNVGGPRPGEAADETSLTEADWTRWMTTWADAGLNVLRVYRLHDPALYAALVAWNEAHPSEPIYLLQGVYYREVAAGAPTDLFGYASAFDDDVAHVIDCVHGACAGYPDASAWTMGWLVGRELMPDEVMGTDAAHPDTTAYAGTALSIASATPSAVWAVARMDHAIAWERAHHASERPIGFTLWPPLDPLPHPTERPIWQADLVSLDLAGVDASAAPAGHFISYHAYPYDPDFILEDPDYLAAADAVGTNSYRAYLSALRAHYADQALLIAEFGVPTSLASAHASPSGMSQGGLDEAQQGAFAARMLGNIEDVGAAGGIWFQWEDGWWKQSWTSIGRAFPRNRFVLWHNLLDPEQAFGLIAFEPAMSDAVELELAAPATHVRSVRASSSAAILRLEITLDAPLAAGETIEIGLDVLDRLRGEPALPSGRALARSRAEVAITLEDARARMRVSPCLDTNRLLDSAFVAATRAGGCGGWADLRWVLTNQHARPPEGCFVARAFFDLGALAVRAASEPATHRDQIVIDGSTIRLDLAWSLLLVADPSTRSVVDDRADTDGVDATVTDGVVVAVAARDELVETSPYLWPTWDAAPATSERLKDGAETFFSFTRALPRWLD